MQAVLSESQDLLYEIYTNKGKKKVFESFVLLSPPYWLQSFTSM